jgi:hypothetical protein
VRPSISFLASDLDATSAIKPLAWDSAHARRRLSRFMAIKMKVTPLKEEKMEEKEGPETLPESPLLELPDAAVKKAVPVETRMA